MKLNRKFLKYLTDDKILVVPLADADFSGILRGNKTVGCILDYLDQDLSEEEIVRAMCDRFDGDPELIKADVHDVITRLVEIGAIDE